MSRPPYNKGHWVIAQMGNLFASLYVKAPRSDRYRSRDYAKMLEVVRSEREYASFEELEEALR